MWLVTEINRVINAMVHLEIAAVLLCGFDVAPWRCSDVAMWLDGYVAYMARLCGYVVNS